MALLATCRQLAISCSKYSKLLGTAVLGALCFFGRLSNAETHDEVIAQFLAQGAVFDLDDDFTAYGLPLTNPGRVRRLDYGLTGARVYASQLDHAPGPADHLTVRYGFDFHHVGGDSLWSQEALEHALTVGQFDEAWKLLSIAAETLLGETPAENSVPRSDSRIPQEVLQHAGRVRGDQVESFSLRQLRRLHRHLLQLRRNPFDARLRHAAGRFSDSCFSSSLGNMFV